MAATITFDETKALIKACLDPKLLPTLKEMAGAIANRLGCSVGAVLATPRTPAGCNLLHLALKYEQTGKKVFLLLIFDFLFHHRCFAFCLTRYPLPSTTGPLPDGDLEHWRGLCFRNHKTTKLETSLADCTAT